MILGILKVVVGFIVLPVLIGLILLRSFQEKLIFFPEALPADYKYLFPGKFEEIFIEISPSIKINALHFQVDSPQGVILYFHGNAGSLASWGSVAEDFKKFQYDVIVSDYRGYGKSDGSIKSEKSLYNDSDVLYDLAKKQYGEDQIVVYGRSIGSGIAARLASKNSPRTLVLETPYFNMVDLVKHYYPFVPSFILKYRFPNDLYVKEANLKIFLIHGTEDEIIPYNSSPRLKDLKSDIQLFTIDGGGHNNLSEFPGYDLALAEILSNTN